MGVGRRIVVDLADLVLGATCPGCDRPALTWCRPCAVRARPTPGPVDPAPVALVTGPPVTAALVNTEVVARLLVGWKEQGRFALLRPWAAALASAACLHVDPGRPLALVPVPTDPAHVRRRGGDLVLDLTRLAATELRRTGVEVVAAPCLRRRRHTLDQRGLGASDRQANVRGAFVALPRRIPADHDLVVVDDIVTTGATASEAVRALAAAGRPVRGGCRRRADPAPALTGELAPSPSLCPPVGLRSSVRRARILIHPTAGGLVMEIVVKGRNSEISERFRSHVEDKLQRIEKYDARHRINRIEVEVTHEKNPRQHDTAARIELTVRSRGPVVRAEACSTDQHSALDAVVDKLESRLRKAADRQRIHHGQHAPMSLAQATAVVPEVEEAPADDDAGLSRKVGPLDVQGDGPLVVREKTHQTHSMTLDQALYEMELVGHDFYLFMEKDSMMPSVVYRRKGFDYGVIHLDVQD
ncbi:ribosomal subunit interface protein [Aeromicrobium marinum DSM 15272]|uniref:Ribosome hibernation promoting factor n=1 Tax=Aeromicrobium marinum DSM 15272 TaxID=585531 RepID=E2SDV0_9ACTN|nr:ribosomal subunit interface protein [Aeromicrobium marinum DSM 15272]